MPVVSISAVIALRGWCYLGTKILRYTIDLGFDFRYRQQVLIFRLVCRCRGCSLLPRSLNYRLVILLLRITVVTCDRTGTIVDIRKDAGGYPNASHARRLNRLGSQFSVFYSSNVYG